MVSDDDGAQHLKSLKVSWKKSKSSFKTCICQKESKENLSGQVEASNLQGGYQVSYIFILFRIFQLSGTVTGHLLNVLLNL